MNHLDDLSYLPDCLVEAGPAAERRMIEAYGACGVRHLVLSHPLCRRICKEPAFLPSLLGTMRGTGLDFRDCHAPYGEAYDFNGDGSGLEDHRRLIGLCGELSVKTYTIHLGPAYGGQTAADALSKTRRMVEKLLPRAADAGVVLCIENLYQPLTTVGNLLSVLRSFDSPCFGFCYDSGHANLMTDGVRRGVLCDWVRKPWEDAGEVPVCEDYSVLRPYLATCHLHDNPGDSDAHMEPGREGCTVDWPQLVRRLESAPRLVSLQSEVHATVYRLTAADLVASFRRVFP